MISLTSLYPYLYHYVSAKTPLFLKIYLYSTFILYFTRKEDEYQSRSNGGIYRIG